MSRVIALSLLATLACFGGAVAQDASGSDGPAEAPPVEFSGTQYVDSRGCVFMRAGIGGQTAWVARMTPDRMPLCGYPPSIAPAPPVVVAAEPVPPATEVATVEAPAPAPVATRQPVRKAKAPHPTVRARAPRPSQQPPQTCPEDAPYSGTFTARDGAVIGICSSDARRGVRVATVPVPALVPGRMSGPMTVREGVLTPQGAMAPAQVGPSAYVQIGAYAEPENASGAKARISGLGLPIAHASVHDGNRPIEIVLAGPFGGAGEARAALSAARGAGFRDAFIR